MVVRNWVKTVDGQTTSHGRGCWVFCPGCQMSHVFDVVGEDGSQPDHQPWQWDGNMEQPTFSPSMLAYNSVHLCPPSYVHHEVCTDRENCGRSAHLILNADGKDVPPSDEQILGHNLPHAIDPAWGNCHSFLRAGRWEFLGDSAHALTGQTVDMVPLPDWLVR